MSDDEERKDEPAELPSRRIEGREDFRQLVRDAFAAAAREGWREIILSDADFADWPLGERAVAESLQAWSRSGRRCTLLARNWDAVLRDHARFVAWRKTWGHIIEARVCPSADVLELPSAIWSPHWALQRLDPERCRGWCGTDAEHRLLLREALNEWLQKSGPGFAASTLGL